VSQKCKYEILFFLIFLGMIYYSEIFDSRFLDMFCFLYISNLGKVTFAASEIGLCLIKLRT